MLLRKLFLAALCLFLFCYLCGGHQLASEGSDEYDDDDYVEEVDSAFVAPVAVPLEPEIEPVLSQSSWKQRLTAAQIWDKNKLELGVLVVLLVVIARIRQGSEANTEVAKQWIRTVKDDFKEHFGTVGFENTYLKGVNWQNFEFYATDKKGCSYCIGRLSCVPRQCLWTSIFHFVTRGTDALFLEFGIDTPEKFTFLIGKRRKLKSLQSIHPDVGDSTCVRKAPHPSFQHLVALTDTAEVVEKCLSAEVCKNLQAACNVFDWILFTDLVPSERYPEVEDRRILRINMKLPRGSMSEVKEFTRVVLRLVTVLAGLRLTEKARAEVRKAREVVEKRKESERIEEMKRKPRATREKEAETTDRKKKK